MIKRAQMDVPLEHPPGRAQTNPVEAWTVSGAVKPKLHFVIFDLPHTDASVLCERCTGAMPCRRASLHVILPLRLSS